MSDEPVLLQNPDKYIERAKREIDRINRCPNLTNYYFEGLFKRAHWDETGALFHVFFNELFDLRTNNKYKGVPWRAFIAVEDGTKTQIHYIGVPVRCKTAKEAVAWTYGLTEAEYTNIVRT